MARRKTTVISTQIKYAKLLFYLPTDRKEHCTFYKCTIYKIVCPSVPHTHTHYFFNAKAFSFCKQIFLSFNSGGHCLEIYEFGSVKQR